MLLVHTACHCLQRTHFKPRSSGITGTVFPSRPKRNQQQMLVPFGPLQQGRSTFLKPAPRSGKTRTKNKEQTYYMVGLKPSSSRKIPPQRFPLREMLSDSRGWDFHDSSMHLVVTLVSSGGRTLSQNSWQGVCVVFSSWIGAACVLHVKARCARRRKL